MGESGVSQGGCQLKDPVPLYVMDWKWEVVKCDLGTIQCWHFISPLNSFLFNLLQRSQIMLYSSPLPNVYSLIMSYSWSLGSVSSHLLCFFKDALKLSTQDFSCTPCNSSRDNVKKTLPSTPSYRTWAPADWKHSAGPNDLTKVATSSAVPWLHAAMGRVFHRLFPPAFSFFLLLETKWRKRKSAQGGFGGVKSQIIKLS